MIQFQSVGKLIKFFSEVRLELTKVTWPKGHDVIRLTLIVILVTVGVGLYTGGLDFLYVKGLEFFVAK